MTVAVISDPHGDVRALEAALGAATVLGAERVWCLGDLVGSDHPNETVELAVQECGVVLAGNHDLVAVRRLDESLVGTHGGEAMLDIRERLTSAVRQILENLPTEVVQRGCFLTHASDHDPLARVTDPLDAQVQLALRDEAVVVVGHCHRPFGYFFGEDRWVDSVPPIGRVALDPEGVVLCPGSVIDVTDQAPPSLLILDLDDRTAKWIEIP